MNNISQSNRFTPSESPLISSKTSNQAIPNQIAELGQNATSQIIPSQIPTQSHSVRRMSMDLAVERHEKKRQQSENISLKSTWLLCRSDYHLNEVKERRLLEFKTYLEAMVSSLLIAIKAICSNEVKEKPNSIAVLADAAVAASFGAIPHVGPFLEKAISFAAPAERITSYFRKKLFEKLSQFLTKFSQMDLITEEFTALVVGYHQAEILSPSQNRTTAQQKIEDPIRNFVKGVIAWINQPGIMEKYVTGTDDLIKEKETTYKEHWPHLLENIISKFLSNLDELSFESVLNNQIAIQLSQPLTPLSHAPLIFTPASVNLITHYAHTLSRVALLSYESERKIEELAAQWGFSQPDRMYQFFYQNDIQAFVLGDSERVVVSFRGTDTLCNMITDLNFRKIAPWNNEIEVHAGFWNGLQEVWPKVKDSITQFLNTFTERRQKPEIYFTGHSLGGAMALLAAYDLQQNKAIESSTMHVYTFGQPKCGNQAFAQAVQTCIPHYHRVVNYLDPVSVIPTSSMLGNSHYMHTGHMQWLNFQNTFLHDQEQYEKALEKTDAYGKPLLRRHEFKYLQHVMDHQMTSYEANLRNLNSKNHTCFSYAEFAEFEFQKRMIEIEQAETHSQVLAQNANQRAEALEDQISCIRQTIESRIVVQKLHETGVSLEDVEGVRHRLYTSYLSSEANAIQLLLTTKSVSISDFYLDLTLSVANKPVKQFQLQDLFAKDVAPKNVLLIGEPCSGKSTLCSKILHDWAHPQIQLWADRFSVVFCIRLREITTEKYPTPIFLPEIIARECLLLKSESDRLKTVKILEHVFEKQADKILILFDGFDECGMPNWLKKQLFESNDQVSRFFTSRLQAVQELQNKVNVIIENHGFAEAQIKKFVEAYYKITTRSEKAQTLLTFLNSQPALKELAKLPLILQMICFLWERESDKFSAKKFNLTQVYHELTSYFMRWYFLKKEDITGEYQQNAYQHKMLQALGEIAYKAFTYSGIKHIPKDLVTEIRTKFGFDVKSFYSAGFLVPFNSEARFLEDKESSFLHLSFQEYLAALYLSRQDEATLKTFMQSFKYDPKFQQVLVFLCGICAMKNQPEQLDQLFDLFNAPPQDIFGVYHSLLEAKLLNACFHMEIKRKEEILKKVAWWIECSLKYEANISYELTSHLDLLYHIKNSKTIKEAFEKNIKYSYKPNVSLPDVLRQDEAIQKEIKSRKEKFYRHEDKDIRRKWENFVIEIDNLRSQLYISDMSIETLVKNFEESHSSRKEIAKLIFSFHLSKVIYFEENFNYTVLHLNSDSYSLDLRLDKSVAKDLLKILTSLKADFIFKVNYYFLNENLDNLKNTSVSVVKNFFYDYTVLGLFFKMGEMKPQKPQGTPND